jgi:hypothetical protein
MVPRTRRACPIAVLPDDRGPEDVLRPSYTASWDHDSGSHVAVKDPAGFTGDHSFVDKASAVPCKLTESLAPEMGWA